MGRPATGSPKWNAAKNRWEARVTLPGGVRQSLPLHGIRKCERTPAGSPASCPCRSCLQARRSAQVVSNEVRQHGRALNLGNESFASWVETHLRLLKVKVDTKQWADTERQFRRHILPVIGATGSDEFDERAVVTLRDSFAEKVSSGAMSMSRAKTMWCTAAAAARQWEISGTLQRNPFRFVAGPGGGTADDFPLDADARDFIVFLKNENEALRRENAKLRTEVEFRKAGMR